MLIKQGCSVTKPGSNNIFSFSRPCEYKNYFQSSTSCVTFRFSVLALPGRFFLDKKQMG